jgi:hypothetical protein
MLPQVSAWSLRPAIKPIRGPCSATRLGRATRPSRPVRASPGPLCTSSSSSSALQAPFQTWCCSCQTATRIPHGRSAAASAAGPLTLSRMSQTCFTVRPSRRRTAVAAAGGGGLDPPPSAAAVGPSAPLAQQQQQQPLPLGSCPRCQGEGRVPCKACEGSGRLKRGGYQKRNRVDLSRAVGGCARSSCIDHNHSFQVAMFAAAERCPRQQMAKHLTSVHVVRPFCWPAAGLRLPGPFTL